MADKKLQPIIIKRVKRTTGHTAHTAAWKIAYADFVTAMMAFFMLMWLISFTDPGQLRGIASYFNSPTKVSMMGGPGSGSSDSILPGSGRDLTVSNGQVGGAEAERIAMIMGGQLGRAEQARRDEIRIEALQRELVSVIMKTPNLAEYASQIQLEKTVDGLHIQIVDEKNRPMFDTGSALVKPYMRDILRAIGLALGNVENRIALAGHTDATPYGSGYRGYSNWELSADRANASRRELVAGGLPDDKLLRVEGLASSQLRTPQAPSDPINRRISIVVLTQEAEQRLMPGALAAPPQPTQPTQSPTPPNAGTAIPPKLGITPVATLAAQAPAAAAAEPLARNPAPSALQIARDLPKSTAEVVR